MRDMYTLLQEIVIGLGSIGEETWYIIQTSKKFMILTTNCTLYDGVTMLSWTYDNWVDVLAIRPSSSKIHQL